MQSKIKEILELQNNVFKKLHAGNLWLDNYNTKNKNEFSLKGSSIFKMNFTNNEEMLFALSKSPPLNIYNRRGIFLGDKQLHDRDKQGNLIGDDVMNTRMSLELDDDNRILRCTNGDVAHAEIQEPFDWRYCFDSSKSLVLVERSTEHDYDDFDKGLTTTPPIEEYVLWGNKNISKQDFIKHVMEHGHKSKVNAENAYNFLKCFAEPTLCENESNLNTIHRFMQWSNDLLDKFKTMK